MHWGTDRCISTMEVFLSSSISNIGAVQEAVDDLHCQIVRTGTDTESDDTTHPTEDHEHGEAGIPYLELARGIAFPEQVDELLKQLIAGLSPGKSLAASSHDLSALDEIK